MHAFLGLELYTHYGLEMQRRSIRAGNYGERARIIEPRRRERNVEKSVDPINHSESLVLSIGTTKEVGKDLLFNGNESKRQNSDLSLSLSLSFHPTLSTLSRALPYLVHDSCRGCSIEEISGFV